MQGHLIVNHRSRSHVLSLVMLSWVLLSGCSARTAGETYETARVARGDIEQRVSASGTLSALGSVDVGSQASGRIVSLGADFNSPVKKGQLIAEIDSSIYVAQLKQAEADIASAEATVLLKQQNLKRKEALFPEHAASQLDLDQAKAELAQAQATAAIKHAAIESARANLGYCRIASPIDGIVISRKVDVGQTLVAAMTTPVLFTIATDISKMNISAAVSEADVGQVRPGQPVDFHVDAFPDETFHGTVVQVRKAPTTSSNVVTYETIIGVQNHEQKLFPGMTADVSILVAERRKILLVPNTALRYVPPEHAQFETKPPTKLERGQRLVYAPGSERGKLRALAVTVGVTDGINTELIDGAQEGAELITYTVSSGTPNASLLTGGNRGGF
jgi:HlyD family secretion protein